MNIVLDVVVVGAGQAGLAVSYFLTQAQIQHLVIEKGNIGESWRSQRWDSFHLNTPNWSNGLPGMDFYVEDPDGFGSRDQLLSYFERYRSAFDLPVRQHTAVTSLSTSATGGYELKAGEDTFHAKVVVLASGGMSRPRVPTLARRLPDDITSLSAATYRNPGALPDGAVVVVGCGQSGCQIVEDLLEAGRHVYLCVSRVGRIPRVYRGREIFVWWRDMGFLDVMVDELEDPSMRFDANPQVSGTDRGHTVSLQSLARDGATLLGRLEDIDGHNLKLGDDLQECIEYANEKSLNFKAAIDNYIKREGILAEEPQPDPGEPPLPDLKSLYQTNTLDLQLAGVSSVIWCTGYNADWSWINLDVFDKNGQPRHQAGIAERRGLYVVGLPWLSRRKSSILYGVSDDAARIVHHIEQHVLSNQ